MLSSIARKNLMALTGLFLCFFLIVHVLGNLPLLLPAEEAQEPFNRYAAILTGLTVIKIASVVTMGAILLHAVLALVLTLRGRSGAGAGYAVAPSESTSPWYSRTMGLSGALILVFIVVHLWDFWYPYKFAGDAVGKDPAGQRDLYSIVVSTCQRWWHVLFYVVSMVVLGFHVHHGIYSGLRSLGLYPSGVARWVRYAGMVFALVVCGLFAAMPVYLYFIHR